jgi:DNA polymerase II large subunit
MAVKLSILKSGEEIISDIKEGMLEDKIVTYILDNPRKITYHGSYKVFNENEEQVDRVNITLEPWPSLSEDQVVPIVTDWVVTVVEPKIELKKMYEEQVLKNGI